MTPPKLIFTRMTAPHPIIPGDAITVPALNKQAQKQNFTGLRGKTSNPAMAVMPA